MIVISFLFIFSAYSFALEEGTYEIIVKKKQEEKQKSRWTLADWLATKRRMDLMDQWLLLNTHETAVEVFLDASQAKMNIEDTPRLYYREESYQRFQAGVFFYPLGLEYKMDKLGEGSSIDYLFSLRLLGSSLQTTNLIVSYGRNVRENATDGDLKNNFVQARGNLYIFDFLGLMGKYRLVHENQNEAATLSVQGSQVSYGAFLEYELVRLYFEIFREKNEFHTIPSNQSSEIENKGSFLGLQIYL